MSACCCSARLFCEISRSVYPFLPYKAHHVAIHTSSINSIVDPAEFLDSFQDELLDLLGAGDICLRD